MRTSLRPLRRGGRLARQVVAGAATGHSAPPPRVPEGILVATRMRRDYAQFTRATSDAGRLAGSRGV